MRELIVKDKRNNLIETSMVSIMLKSKILKAQGPQKSLQQNFIRSMPKIF